jgi:hypothetical protein
LNEIYNDIEWSGTHPTYDINIILEILKLWDHPVAKVKYHVKRVLKLVCKLSGNTEKFLKTLSYYTSETLQSEILKLFYGQSLSNNILTNAANVHNMKFDVATQRVISALPQKLSMSLAKEQNDEAFSLDSLAKHQEQVLNHTADSEKIDLSKMPRKERKSFNNPSNDVPSKKKGLFGRLFGK